MFRVFGYNDLCQNFEFFVDTEEEAIKFKEENWMYVVFYKKVD